MDPFLLGFMVVAIVLTIGKTVERFSTAAKALFVISTIVLIAEQIYSVLMSLTR